MPYSTVSYPIARGIVNGNFYIVIMTGSLNLRSELVLLAQISATPLVRKGPRESEAVMVPLSVEVECENVNQFDRVTVVL